MRLLLLLAVLPLPLAAHVHVAPETVARGGRAELTLIVGHGCKGAATTALRAALPPALSAVTVLEKPGWTVTTTAQEVAWHGGPLPDHDTGTFTLSATIAGDAPETVPIPVIQICGDTETRWIGAEKPGAEYSAVSLLWRVLSGLAVLVLCAGAALAHASLLASDPPDGALLEAAPGTVTLTFNEPTRPLAARLTAADGTTRLLLPPRAEGDRLVYPLPPDMGQGTHLLSWRVTAADGHPLAGGVVFSVGAETGAVGAPDTGSPATRGLLWAARAGLIASVLLAVGGTARAGWVGLALVPVVLGAQGLDLLGLPPGALLTAAPWREGGGIALVLTGAALLAGVLRARGVAVLLAGLAAAAAGHAATAPLQLVMRPAVALHVMAAALWIGALWPLARSLTDPAPLRRFGRRIPWIVALLVGSGCVIAGVQLGRPAALWETDFGRVLGLKLALVAVLLLVALVNRLWLAPRAEAGDIRPLRRAIVVELVLAALIVGTLSLWRFTPPPRSLPERVQVIAAEGLSATLRVAPPRRGPVTLGLSDLRLDGVPVVPQAVEVELAKPAYGLGPFQHSLPGAAGEIGLGTFVLPLDGYWVLTLDVRLSDFHAIRIRDIVEIAP
ncbi:copper resistance protein CopC [Paenirhodobacter sp.]|uniref:copper resistance protein CopC n=1 Tax=Paenirhodobacter sp. TaxID=1965326 RepID=UPI003B3BFE8E